MTCPSCEDTGFNGKCESCGHVVATIVYDEDDSEQDLAFYAAFKPKKRCALYRIVNLRNAQTYFGTSVDPSRRWKTHRKRARQGHGAKLYESIRLHGASYHAFAVVKWFDSIEQARSAERFLIELGLAELNMGRF
jgi:predicted GIY-YIG superfamily endonuclease